MLPPWDGRTRGVTRSDNGAPSTRMRGGGHKERSRRTRTREPARRETSNDFARRDLAEREHKVARAGVREHLPRADIERDEGGDDAERAARFIECDPVRSGEFAWTDPVSSCEARRPDNRYSPAPSSANVIVRKKNRTTRPMFLRRDPMLMIAS